MVGRKDIKYIVASAAQLTNQRRSLSLLPGVLPNQMNIILDLVGKQYIIGLSV